MGHSKANCVRTRVTPPHQAVVNRLRDRLRQYRRHHQTSLDKYERSFPLRQKQDRQDSLLLHEQAVESGSSNTINSLKAKQQETGSKASKQDQPPNGLEKSASSTSAIIQPRILKRNLDQNLNNSDQTTGHSLEVSEQGDCLSKYQRGLIQDDIHSLVNERQISAPSAQQAE